jgi:hypothetical protein
VKIDSEEGNAALVARAVALSLETRERSLFYTETKSSRPKYALK